MLRTASSSLRTLFGHAFIKFPMRGRNITSLSHSDIPTFLRYARLSGLDPEKTVFTGTLYEYTVLLALSRIPGISLCRIGGKDDAGIDLQGVWELPTIVENRQKENKEAIFNEAEEEDDEDEAASSGGGMRPLPLIVQCKYGSEKSSKGPQYIRELKGALASQSIHTLGILARMRDMTAGMKKHMISSRRPLGFVKVTPLEGIQNPGLFTSATGDDLRDAKAEFDEDIDHKDDGDVKFRLTGRGGLLQQFVWNEAANRYLGGFGITARYVPRNYGVTNINVELFDKQLEEEELEQEITLMWNGVPMSTSP